MTYGNLAYKTEAPSREQVQQKHNTKAKQNSAKYRRTNKLNFAERTACVVIVSLAAIFMIVQFIKVNETQSALSAAIERFRFEESVTAQKSFELEQSIDLSKIEQEATTRLGMKLPEKHQIVYLDIKKDDITDKTAKEVEGVSNRLVSGVKSLVSYIVKVFSI